MTPHGSASTYANHGCRCDACRNAHNAYATQRRNDIKAGRKAIPPTVAHGRHSTYVNWCCRCRACRRANADYVRDHPFQAKPIRADQHGRLSTYVHYGCRCDACREANRVRSAKAYRARKVSA